MDIAADDLGLDRLTLMSRDQERVIGNLRNSWEGRVSGLLRLPGEIRNRIYSYLLSPHYGSNHTQKLNPAYDKSARDSEPLAQKWKPEKAKIGDPQCKNRSLEKITLYPSILRVSQQIYEEAAGILGLTDWIYVEVNWCMFANNLKRQGFPVLVCPDGASPRPFLNLRLEFASEFASPRHGPCRDAFVLPDYCATHLYRIITTTKGMEDVDLCVTLDLKNLHRSQIDLTPLYAISRVRSLTAHLACPEKIVPIEQITGLVNVAGRNFGILPVGGVSRVVTPGIEQHTSDVFYKCIGLLVRMEHYLFETREFKTALDVCADGIAIICDLDRDAEGHIWASIRENTATLIIMAQMFAEGLMRAAHRLGHFETVIKYSTYLRKCLMEDENDVALLLSYRGQANLSLGRVGEAIFDFLYILDTCNVSADMLQKFSRFCLGLDIESMRSVGRIVYNLRKKSKIGLFPEPMEDRLDWWLKRVQGTYPVVDDQGDDDEVDPDLTEKIFGCVKPPSLLWWA